MVCRSCPVAVHHHLPTLAPPVERPAGRMGGRVRPHDRRDHTPVEEQPRAGTADLPASPPASRIRGSSAKKPGVPSDVGSSATIRRPRPPHRGAALARHFAHRSPMERRKTDHSRTSRARRAAILSHYAGSAIVIRAVRVWPSSRRGADASRFLEPDQGSSCRASVRPPRQALGGASSSCRGAGGPSRHTALSAGRALPWSATHAPRPALAFQEDSGHVWRPRSNAVEGDIGDADAAALPADGAEIKGRSTVSSRCRRPRPRQPETRRETMRASFAATTRPRSCARAPPPSGGRDQGTRAHRARLEHAGRSIPSRAASPMPCPRPPSCTPGAPAKEYCGATDIA